MRAASSPGACSLSEATSTTSYPSARSISACMLLPRPEISTATRRLSAMVVGRGPVLAGAPGVGRTANGTAALARFDLADPVDGLASLGERLRDGVRIGGDDGDHADAAIEGPRQFAGLDSAARLQEGE